MKLAHRHALLSLPSLLTYCSGALIPPSAGRGLLRIQGGAPRSRLIFASGDVVGAVSRAAPPSPSRRRWRPTYSPHHNSPLAPGPGPPRGQMGRRSASRVGAAASEVGGDGDATTMTTIGPLERLCRVTKRACDALAPLIVALYRSIDAGNNSDGTKLKDDGSAFTIADGAVQHLLVQHLFAGSSFRDVVGEEDCEVELSRPPYSVDGMAVPDEFVPLLEKARRDVGLLAKEISRGDDREGTDPIGDDDVDPYRSLTVFVDPIDGTREFSTGRGEQCTVCVGFSDDVRGHPVAGVVYRPIDGTWAAGAKSEDYFASELRIRDTAEGTPPPFPPSGEGGSTTGGTGRGRLLTSNGSISPFLAQLMEELRYDQAPAGGAGNKALMLLEGRGEAYVQDRGVSRWDTCAAQACLEAHGGILCKLTSFLGKDGTEEGYTYLRSDVNLDFEPGSASLTAYNCRPSVGMKRGEASRPCRDVEEVKPYSNLCGLLALGREANTEVNKRAILAAAVAASGVSKPAYD